MARARAGLTVGYAISLLGSVFSLMVYARELGPHMYGQLAVYFAFVEAFQCIVFQWHRLALVRYWKGTGEPDADTYLVTSHIVWAAIGAASVTIAVLPIIIGGFNEVWLAVVALSLAKSAALYTQEMARVRTAVARYALASLLMTIGSTAASIIVWNSSRSINLMLYASAAVFLVQSAFCGCDRLTAFRHARFDTPQLRSMLSYGLPLVPVFLTTIAMTRLDRPILAAFESADVVGVYAAGSGLATNAVSAACLLVVTPSYPWLLKEMAGRTTDEHRVLHARVGSLMLSGVLAVCIALVMLREIALPLMLGRAIGTAAEPLILPLLSIAAIAAFRAHFFDQAYHLHARTKVLMSINLMTLGMATLSTYLGARIGGCQGLINALLIVNTTALIVSAAFARSIVSLDRVIIGAVRSVGLAAAALFIGYQSRYLFERLLDRSDWPLMLSTFVALTFFSVTSIACNFGTIRGLIKGNL